MKIIFYKRRANLVGYGRGLFKKFESTFFSHDRIRLSNSCCVVASHPPSLTFCAKILHKFYIGLACGTFGAPACFFLNYFLRIFRGLSTDSKGAKFVLFGFGSGSEKLNFYS